MSGSYKGKHTARSGSNILILIVVAAAALAMAAFVVQTRSAGAQPQGSGSQDIPPAQSAGVSDASQSSGSGPDVSVQQPDVSQPPTVEDPLVEDPPEAEPYDFSQPVPQSEAVDNSYFDDAAFVGDSRTDGFMIYSGIGTGKNLTSNGLSIFKLAEKKALTIGGKTYTLMEALAMEEYGKVYISLGVNELGYNNDKNYYEKYGQAIDEIRQIQPDAVIYIQGLIPLNEGQIKKANGNKYHLTNEHLRVYNDLMKQVAEEKQVAYLDLYSEFVDENGALPDGASRDGVHLTKDSCKQWLDYLKEHTVNFDTLYPDGLPADENTAPDTAPEDGSGQG